MKQVREKVISLHQEIHYLLLKQDKVRALPGQKRPNFKNHPAVRAEDHTAPGRRDNGGGARHEAAPAHGQRTQAAVEGGQQADPRAHHRPAVHLWYQ